MTSTQIKPPRNIVLRDLTLRHHANMYGFAADILRDVNSSLHVGDQEIIGLLMRHDLTRGERGTAPVRLARAVGAIAMSHTAAYERAAGVAMKRMKTLAHYEMRHHADVLGSVFNVKLVLPAVEMIDDIVTRPWAGGWTFGNTIASLRVDEMHKIVAAIRNAHMNEVSTQDLIREIQGTPELNFKDGILPMARRPWGKMVRTMTTRTMNVARRELAKYNTAIGV